jgi:hypothetical protein
MKASSDVDKVRRLADDTAEREKLLATRLARARELDLAEAPIVEELRSAGVSVASLLELRSLPRGRELVMPILLSHLENKHHPQFVRVLLALGLLVPEAKSAHSKIEKLYLAEVDSEIRDVLAQAVANTAKTIDDIVRLASDEKNGPSRIFFVPKLTRSKSPNARAAVGRLSTDPDLAKELAARLRRRKLQ